MHLLNNSRTPRVPAAVLPIGLLALLLPLCACQTPLTRTGAPRADLTLEQRAVDLLLRAARSEDPELASNALEALVAVAGVPVTTWSADADAVVATHVDAVLEVCHDPDLGSRTPIAVVRDGRPPAQRPCVDPADLETRRATLPSAQAAVQLRARATLKLTLGLDLP